MTDKLKKCPFCGGEAYVSNEDCYGNVDDNYLVHCDECGLQLGFTNQYVTEEEAIKAWNKRSYIDEIVEQLEEAQNHCCVGCYEDYDPYEDGRFETYEEVITLLKGVQNE